MARCARRTTAATSRARWSAGRPGARTTVPRTRRTRVAARPSTRVLATRGRAPSPTRWRGPRTTTRAPRVAHATAPTASASATRASRTRTAPCRPCSSKCTAVCTHHVLERYYYIYLFVVECTTLVLHETPFVVQST